MLILVPILICDSLGRVQYKSGRSDSDGFEIDPYKEEGQASPETGIGYADDVELTDYTGES